MYSADSVAILAEDRLSEEPWPRRTARCSSFADALATNDLTTLVAKVEAVGPSGYVTDLSLLENRYQFQRYLREVRSVSS